MAVKHGLGRGLDALIKDGTPPPTVSPVSPASPEAPAQPVHKVALDRVRKAPWQPRREFDEAAMAELVASIAEHGVLQPLLVRPRDAHYELMAGERRLRAAAQAGLAEVPVVILEADDRTAFQVALIENLQREDLTVLEEAEGYRVLADKFDMTQDEIAKRVGKARATVANALRLLGLPEDVKALIADRSLSAGHAKVLTGLDKVTDQLYYARRVLDEGLSVRNLEKLVEHGRRAPRKPRAVRADVPTEHVTYLVDRLRQHFGTDVRIEPSRTFANGKKGKGTVQIDFYSNDELDRILTLLGFAE